MQNAYYTEGQPDSDPQKLLGTVVRYQVTAGQPLTRGSLVGPKDRGFLAAALGPGMRAVTVPVNASTGVANRVGNGDRLPCGGTGVGGGAVVRPAAPACIATATTSSAEKTPAARRERGVTRWRGCRGGRCATEPA